MGRADAAGGEHIVVPRPTAPDRVDDLDPRYPPPRAPRAAGCRARPAERDIGQVGVLGAARQNLVADDQDGGGGTVGRIGGHGHDPMLVHGRSGCEPQS